MKILITGSTGFLGPYLMQAFSDIGDVTGVSRSGDNDYPCDLTDPSQVAVMMSAIKPAMVIHAAAMTNVDMCEKLPAQAIANNCKATENVTDLAPDGCLIVYISSDMIYSGQGRHREDSHTENPINMYGMSKYMGELAVRRRENHLIVRTNMVGFSQGNRKSSLVNFLQQKFKSGDGVSLFTDALFSPLSTKSLCHYLRIMTETSVTGTFNLGSSTGMSKAKFGLLLAHELKLPAYSAIPADSMSLPGRAPRPADTRMDITRVESRFGFTLPTLESEIRMICRDHLCVH